MRKFLIVVEWEKNATVMADYFEIEDGNLKFTILKNDQVVECGLFKNWMFVIEVPIVKDKKERLRINLIKAWLAIHYDTCPEGFYTADYIKEKIEKIVLDTIKWHPNIEDIEDEAIDNMVEYILKIKDRLE